MEQSTAGSEFSRSLLEEVEPQEIEFFAAYEAALTKAASGKSIGPGFGLPPELQGAVGVLAVLVGHVVYNKLLEWGALLAGEVSKKFIVDTAVDRLKKWLAKPGKGTLEGVLTAQGQLEILAIVDRDAAAARLSPADSERLRKAVIAQLGLIRT